jgi:hypothetical protein
MRNHINTSVLTLGAAALVALFYTSAHPAGQAPAGSAATQFPSGYKGPRTADGKPDLNGIWQAFTTANWDLQDHPASAGPKPTAVGIYGAEPAGLGVVEGGEIPYRPEMLAKKKENLENRLTADPHNRDIGDPEAKCYMPGVPRATYMPFPFQIIQGTDKIMIAYEFAGVGRVIHLTKQGPAPIESWMGISEGRYEGDTLVVDVRDLNDRTWFDRAGDFHSEELKVTERYTAVSPYHLMYEATITDPKVFTRPWKISFPLYRRMEKGARLLEFKCVELSEEFLYGSLRKQTSR